MVIENNLTARLEQRKQQGWGYTMFQGFITTWKTSSSQCQRVTPVE